jgi:hypothetical protein
MSDEPVPSEQASPPATEWIALATEKGAAEQRKQLGEEKEEGQRIRPIQNLEHNPITALLELIDEAEAILKRGPEAIRDLVIAYLPEISSESKSYSVETQKAIEAINLEPHKFVDSILQLGLHKDGITDIYLHMADKCYVVMDKAMAGSTIHFYPNEIAELAAELYIRAQREINVRKEEIEGRRFNLSSEQQAEGSPAAALDYEMAGIESRQQRLNEGWEKNHQRTMGYFDELKQENEEQRQQLLIEEADEPDHVKEQTRKQLEQKDKDIETLRTRFENLIKGTTSLASLKSKEEQDHEFTTTPASAPPPGMAAALEAARGVDCSWSAGKAAGCDVTAGAPPPPVPDLSATAADIHARR